MTRQKIFRTVLSVLSFLPMEVVAETAEVTAVSQLVTPYRTFVTLQRYSIKQNGEPNQPISSVKVDITLPDGKKRPLPDAGQYWVVGNGQAQEINRTYEIPWDFIKNDGFRFTIQMIRKSSAMLPCEFDVISLSDFNRTYVCHTDLGWQQNQNIAAENLDEEAIQVRVFTDKNSRPNEIPKDIIAIR